MTSHVIPDGCVDAAYSIGALPNRGRGASSFSLFPMTQYAAISQPIEENARAAVVAARRSVWAMYEDAAAIGNPAPARMENQRRVQAIAVRAALAVLVLGQCGPTHAESLSDGHFVDEVPRLLEQYSRQGDFQLPSLSITELDTLAAGKTVVAVFREPTAPVDTGRVVGWQVVAAPRLLVWLSILEGSEESSARLKHSTLTWRAAGAYVSYHHIDLPWPVKDRQWTLLCEKNLSLAEDSHGLIWEHRWELLPRDDALLEDAYEHGLIPGLTRQVLDDSVYLGANRGAWILFDLGARGTLVAAYMDIDLGGHIPDSLVRSFAKRQLTAFLESLSALRGAHYDGTPMIHDGRGLPITREAAITAALVQLDQPRLVNALP